MRAGEETVEPPGDGAPPPPQRPMRIVRSKPKRRHPWRDRFVRLLTPVLPLLLSGALRLLARTVRVTYVQAETLFDHWTRGQQVIVAFWHNRVVMMPLAAQGRGRKLCIMNSQHRDAELATRALERWGIRSVRGSASRGGAGGFLQLVNAFRSGYDLAVVPDGPRGPRYVAKRGVIHLARATGAPIFPVSYAATRKRQLRSWDRLILPLPFSRIVYVVGEALSVPRHANEEEVETLRRELEARLAAATERAETLASELS